MDFYIAGQRLKTIRLARGMTQAALAEKVGLSTNYYSAVERGKKIPLLETMVQICNALDASLDDVLADQLHHGHGMTMQANRLSAELNNLPLRDQQYILAALEAMIQTSYRLTRL